MNNAKERWSGSPMPIYKCPACGRSNLALPNLTPSDTEAGAVATINVETEVKCHDCGWYGPATQLKLGH
jgi:hypothetical protein